MRFSADLLWKNKIVSNHWSWCFRDKLLSFLISNPLVSYVVRTSRAVLPEDFELLEDAMTASLGGSVSRFVSRDVRIYLSSGSDANQSPQ